LYLLLLSVSVLL